MSHPFTTLTVDELTRTTGGQVAPSTGINIGVKVMELLDHPKKTLDTVKRALGIPNSGRPGDIYTPARATPDGSITPGRFDTPRTPGAPEVPTGR